MTGTLIAVLVALLIIVPSIIKVVPEYKRLVILRLGRCIGEKGPGLVIVIPVIDVPVWADLRESFMEIPEQTCITKDNAPISIDFLIYWKVTDPVKSVVQVNNFAGAAQGIATTTLRAIVGDIPLDDVLAKREEINLRLRAKMDEVTERWGVKVTSVEIREIIPPKDIQDAMNKQMSAERNRRAIVTEAEGTKSAAITVAEGEKQSKILQAEGKRQAQMLEAEGYAKALEQIFAAAGKIDSKTMLIQYFEALKELGANSSTKFVIPMEFTSLVEPIIKKARESLK
ncbi:MAG TPA: SPFH domain-containing protein [Candidatus Goldiibacteriota bacterium]|nr:SPFH domain-containing protein [Candidatus Goldiibacteriota bacterium]